MASLQSFQKSVNLQYQNCITSYDIRYNYNHPIRCWNKGTNDMQNPQECHKPTMSVNKKNSCHPATWNPETHYPELVNNIRPYTMQASTINHRKKNKNKDEFLGNKMLLTPLIPSQIEEKYHQYPIKQSKIAYQTYTS